MPAAARGLSDEEVVTLREEVAAGRAPRVRIDGAQFGSTTSGTVRSVGDPEVDGADFVTVRVKVNGVTDDLRFAPRELVRGGRSKDVPASQASAKPARSRSRRASSAAAVADGGPVAGSTLPPPTRAASTKAAPTKAVSTKGAAPRSTTAVAASAGRSARSKRRTAPSAPVTITFTSSGASWTVSAQRGARSVVKHAPVNPGVVSAVAGMLEVPALAEAVAAVNDTARAEAESRAEQLRAELAEIQAVLDSHRRP